VAVSYDRAPAKRQFYPVQEKAIATVDVIFFWGQSLRLPVSGIVTEHPNPTEVIGEKLVKERLRCDDQELANSGQLLSWNGTGPPSSSRLRP
jgi:hypothetical protein